MMIPCLRCKRFYRCKHVGHAFEEGMPSGQGIDGAPGWKPYKLWIGDLYECEGCGAQTVIGMAGRPLAEHFQPVYAEMAARYESQVDGLVRIDDCPGSFSQERADKLQGKESSGRPGYCGRCGCYQDLHRPDNIAGHEFIQETGRDHHENIVNTMWPDLSPEINTPSPLTATVDAMQRRHEVWKNCPNPPCCDRAGEYNGFGSDGPVSFTCPKSCPCHD